MRLFQAVLLAAVGLLTSCSPAFWQGFNEGFNSANYGTSTQAINSYITSDFDGLDHGNVYVLANGQVWQQSEYRFAYQYAFHPRVTIFYTTVGYRMQVEGISGPVTVQRLG